MLRKNSRCDNYQQELKVTRVERRRKKKSRSREEHTRALNQQYKKKAKEMGWRIFFFFLFYLCDGSREDKCSGKGEEVRVQQECSD